MNNSASWLQDFFLGEKLQDEKIFSVFSATYFNQQSYVFGNWNTNGTNSSNNSNRVENSIVTNNLSGSHHHNHQPSTVHAPTSSTSSASIVSSSSTSSSSIVSSSIVSSSSSSTTTSSLITSASITSATNSVTNSIKAPFKLDNSPSLNISTLNNSKATASTLISPRDKTTTELTTTSSDTTTSSSTSTTSDINKPFPLSKNLDFEEKPNHHLTHGSSHSTSSSSSSHSTSLHSTSHTSLSSSLSSIGATPFAPISLSSPNSLLKPNEALFSNQKVLLKIINIKYPSVEVVSLFQREYAILSYLNNIDGVMRVIRAQTELGNIFAFILEDNGYKPLTSVYSTLGPTTPTSLAANNPNFISSSSVSSSLSSISSSINNNNNSSSNNNSNNNNVNNTPSNIGSNNINNSNSSNNLINQLPQTFSLSPHTPNSSPAIKQSTPQSASPLFSSNLKYQDIDFTTFITIAIQLASILEEIHLRGCIHRDIRPSNIYINSNNTVRLANFQYSVLKVPNSHSIDSSLLYLKNYPEIGRYNTTSYYYSSPEETGRTQHNVDSRADLYSLGVTFYELLTGRLPFQTNDLSELIHCHFAKKAPFVSDINPNVPYIISSIVDKLLKKSPDERYNSAYGLKRDLEICKFQLSSNCNTEDFVLGVYDVLHRPHIPTDLYSRKNELNSIFASIGRVCKGNKELILVSGHSGVGKTSLINTAKKKSPPGPRFISGKFDQYNRGVPYSAIIEALNELIHLILVLSPMELAFYREKLHRALGPNIGVIVDVMPVLELIVGSYPPVPSLPPSESQNRFDLVFKDFLRVFSEEGHPLILFLDDLQRADEASCRLIRLLLDNNNLKFLLIIGAFRENEPIATGVKSIEALINDDSIRIPITKINLKPLDLTDVNLMVSSSLHKSPKETLSLSEVVLSKTHGNPFFTIQFLKTLFNEDLLFFDVSVDSWKWDLTKIQTRQFTDNVVEFMVGNLQQLGLESQRVLQLASCIGNIFELDMLSIVAERSPEETLKLLTPIIAQDLILNTEDKKYKFVHDRVQQAAYSLVFLGKDKKEIHLNIGRLLYQSSLKDQASNIFDIVNQYNVGIDLVENAEEKLILSKLNYSAGKRAKLSAAYSIANCYLDCAVKTMNLETCWTEHYRTTYEIFFEKSECEFMCGNIDESERILEMVIERSLNSEDRGEAIALKIQQYTLLSKFNDCVEKGIEYLNSQDIFINRKPTDESLRIEYEEIKRKLGNRSFLDLLKVKNTPPPTTCVSVKVIGIMIAPLFFTNIALLSSILLKLADISITEGCSSWSSVGLVMFGIMVCVGRFDDFQVGYEVGKLAMELKEIHNEPSTKGKVTLLFGNFINHWKAHMSTNSALIKQAFLESIESGDMGYGCYSSVHLLFQSILAGHPLVDIYALCKKYKAFIEQYNFIPMLRIAQSLQQLLLEFIGQESLEDESVKEWDEAAFESDLDTIEIECPKGFHYVFRLQGFYILGQYDKAWRAALMTERYLMGIYAHSPMASYYCFKCLTIMALFDTYDENERMDKLVIVSHCLERLEIFAAHSFENFGLMVYLVKAELARVSKRYIDAMELFNEAVSAAQTHKYVQFEALANELAGRMYISLKKMAVAKAYLLEAQHCYSMWGANIKSNLLEIEFPNILNQSTGRAPISQGSKFLQNDSCPTNLEPRLSIRRRSQDITGKSSSIKYPQVDAFDLCSVITVSHSLAEEIYYDRLLKRLMKVVIRNAGASRGFLLLLEDSNKELFPNNNNMFGELNVAASACVTGEKVSVEVYINSNRSTDGGGAPTSVLSPIENSPAIISPILKSTCSQNESFNKAIRDDGTWNLCVSMINYVRRTQCPLLIANAAEEKTFCDDSYVKLQNPKSILVLPIVHQGKLVSILYLENNFTTGAFTSNRLEVLNLLSTQIAVSFQNARLFLQSNHLANQAFLAKEEAEKANKAKSDFISNMSHEMRTPLNHIIGSLELLKEFPLTTDQKELLNISQQSSESLLFMVNNILDLSKVEQGKTVLNLSIFNLVSFLEDSIGAIAPNAHQKSLMVGLYSTPCTSMIPVIGDVNLLRQILVNLLSNAIKFTSKGEVYIRLSVTPNHNNTAYSTLIEVTDSGIGIKQKDFDKLFQRFSQLDTGVNRAYDGSGLGLSICKQLVELMGGNIGIKSKIGEGSIFHFTIDLAKPRDDISPNKELLLHQEDTNIVIFEDNYMIRNQIEQIIESFGIISTTSTFSNTNLSQYLSMDEILVKNNNIVIIGIPLNYNEDQVFNLVENIQTIKKRYHRVDGSGKNRFDFIVITQLALTSSRSLLIESGILLVNRPLKRDSLLNNIIKIIESYKITSPSTLKCTKRLMRSPQLTTISSSNNHLFIKQDQFLIEEEMKCLWLDKSIPPTTPSKLIQKEEKEKYPPNQSTNKCPTLSPSRLIGSTPPHPPFKKSPTINSQHQLRPPQILVIEDNEVNSNILFKMLQKMGITCLDLASNGAEGVEKASTVDYDLILMDIQMPIMDGYEATSRIRKSEGNFKHTPIVAMTANAMGGQREACLQAGCDDYFCKPLKQKDLEGMVKKYLSKTTFIQ